MEWLLFTGIFFIISITLIAGLIFYKKNKELNKKIENLKEQQQVESPKWLS